MEDSTDGYTYRGARALVLLHERELRAFLEVWKAAKAAGVVLPETADPSYRSLDALLHHVLRAARGYMTWMCEKLDLSDPEIRPTPEPALLAAEPDAYLEHVLARWQAPLRGVTGEQAERTEAPSRWGPSYTIDAMLEHAVMHPIRHGFQLRELLAGLSPASSSTGPRA